MAERALALGETDTFDFILARDLGRTLSEVRAMAQAEFVEWRAFYHWEAAMADFQRREAARRGRRQN